MAESPKFARLKGNPGRETQWWRQISDRKRKYGRFAQILQRKWKCGVMCMRNTSGHRNSSVIVDLAMGQIRRSTDCISSYYCYRVGASADVQRWVSARKPSLGGRLQASAGGRTRHLSHAVGQVAPVATTNGHRNSEYLQHVSFVLLASSTEPTHSKAGMVHSVSGWMRGVQVKQWDPLRRCAIPVRLTGVFTTRRYTNLRLPYSTDFLRDF